VNRLFPKVQLVEHPEWVQTEVNATKEPFTLATKVLAFSIKSQLPEVLRPVWIDRLMVMVFPEMLIPVLLLPGGVVGPESSVLEQEVKKAAPKVLKTTVAPAFSRNFRRDSVKFPVLIIIDLSISDL
jgi:hypothetical protein